MGSANRSTRMREKILFGLLSKLQKANKRLHVTCDINDIPLKSIKAEELSSRLNLENQISENVNLLSKRNHTVWLVIDNLDRFKTNEQHSGYEIAKNLSEVCGIHTLVPIRPYAYPDFIRHLGDKAVILLPPDLHEVLRKRVDYIKENQDKLTEFTLIFEDIEGASLELTWCEGIIKNPEDLLKLYYKITKNG